MDNNTVLKAATDAIEAVGVVKEEAKAVLAEAKAASAKIDKAFGPDFEKLWYDLVHLAQDYKDGKVSTTKETIVGLIKQFHDESEADRKARGLMVGGDRASDRTAKAVDTWDKDYDFKSFLFKTGQIKVEEIKQADLMDLAMSSTARNDMHKAFQHAYMDLMLADAIARAQHQSKGKRYPGARATFPQLSAVCDYHRAHLFADITGKAAVDPNDVSDTSDWIPTAFSPEFRELLFLELQVEGLFDMIPYTGKAGTVRVPVNITNSIGHLVPRNLAGSGQTYLLANPFAAADPVQLGTPILDSKKDFTFQMHRGRSIWQGLIDEDTPVPFLAVARRNILLEIARAMETAIINGQGTGDNPPTGEIDTGSGGVNALLYDARNTCFGLRKHVRVQTGSTFAAANAELTVSMLMKSGPILGGKYLVNPRTSVAIITPINFFHVLTDAAVQTAEKFLNRATVLTGALIEVGGRPVVISEYIPTNLNASGIFDNTTTDRTVALIAHRPSFGGMEHRAIEIGVDYYRASDVNDAVGMRRVDWGKYLPSTEKCVVEITNLKTT